MKYTTQMDAARKGIITNEMRITAAVENMNIDTFQKKLASGSIIIPANKNHKNIIPTAVGEGTRTKINVNLGISKDCPQIEKEINKASKAIELNVDAIMD